MTNLINTALTQGFTAKQILDFITKKYPKYAKQVNKAIASGFSVDQIMSFITGGKIGLNKEKSQGGTEFEQTRGRDIQRREDLNRNAIATGTLVAGGLAAPTAIAALQRAVPTTLRTLVPTLVGQQLQQPQVPPTGQSLPLVQTSPTTNNPQTPPIIPNVTPTIPQSSPINQQEIINKIKELSSIGKSPGDIVELFTQKAPEEISKVEKETGKKFIDFIQESLVDPAELARRKALETFKGKERERVETAYPEMAKKEEKIVEIGGMGNAMMENFYQGIFDSLKSGKDTFSGVKDPLLQVAKPAYDAGQIKSVDDLKKFAKFYEEQKKAPKIEKQAIVATPQGVGEVKEIRNGKAIVEVDGKKHQVNEDELIQSPLPEKDLADLHDDLIKGIEKHTEEEVSRMVNFSGYDEGTNSLAFLPYDGALYIYDDLSDEEKAIAMNLMAKRKTSGENHIGAWVEGTKSPAGAAMSAFIKQLQATRGGKGNEYQRKYQTVYSAFEPAIKASKQKKREADKKASEEKKKKKKKS